MSVVFSFVSLILKDVKETKAQHLVEYYFVCVVYSI